MLSVRSLFKQIQTALGAEMINNLHRVFGCEKDGELVKC